MMNPQSSPGTGLQNPDLGQYNIYSRYADRMDSCILTDPSGARAEITLFGAHPVSFTTADGSEVFFMSPTSNLDGVNPIRGGMPLCFPAFGRDNEMLPLHGLIRTQRAKVAPTSGHDGMVTLCFTQNEETMGVWPQKFEYEVTYRISETSFTTEVAVTNYNDTEIFTFQSAFHPYFEVTDAADVTVKGLSGLDYIDKLPDGRRIEKTDTDDIFRFKGFTDSIYKNAPSVLEVSDARRTLVITEQNLPDAVVWCPYGEGEYPDLPRKLQRKYCCVERGAIVEPVIIRPHSRWECLFTVTVMPLFSGKNS